MSVPLDGQGQVSERKLNRFEGGALRWP